MTLVAFAVAAVPLEDCDAAVPLDELRADVAEMEKMIEGYLAFARGEGTGTPEPADLASVLEQVVGSVRKDGASIDLRSEIVVAKQRGGRTGVAYAKYNTSTLLFEGVQ